MSMMWMLPEDAHTVECPFRTVSHAAKYTKSSLVDVTHVPSIGCSGPSCLYWVWSSKEQATTGTCAFVKTAEPMGS